jgi:hypothetical protein
MNYGDSPNGDGVYFFWLKGCYRVPHLKCLMILNMVNAQNAVMKTMLLIKFQEHQTGRYEFAGQGQNLKNASYLFPYLITVYKRIIRRLIGCTKIRFFPAIVPGPVAAPRRIL